MNRRAFLQNLAGSAAALSITGVDGRAQSHQIPSYLRAYEPLYRKDPHGAAVEWFKHARFGLFMHFGLYTQLERGAWVMLNEKIPVAQYEKLKATFRPDRFDADRIAELALAAGMKYITVTSKHHEGFCLFRTDQTPYNSYDSPARRDLIGELAAACHKKGLGLFLYYSYGADWHHPYFYAPWAGWKFARPDYADPQPQYLWRKDSDFRIYVDYVHNELRELLTNYGPIAGIWFDPILGYYARPDLFPIAETYALISSLQPQCLISFKQGANGSEDFAAPERARVGMHDFDSILPKYRATAAEVARRAWQKNQVKHLEFCNTLEPHAWAYVKADDGKHRNAEEVMQMLQSAWKLKANLLLDTGPLPDGSISVEDVKTLHKVGERLRSLGQQR
ncbi:MAG TPA: alpha-L-fucosidase [Terriglobia bacterium]|nr:alpha-L-fucosidase [Terriglobia bacterium]